MAVAFKSDPAAPGMPSRKQALVAFAASAWLSSEQNGRATPAEQGQRDAVEMVLWYGWPIESMPAAKVTLAAVDAQILQAQHASARKGLELLDAEKTLAHALFDIHARHYLALDDTIQALLRRFRQIAQQPEIH